MLYNSRATDVLRERPICDVCSKHPAAVDGKTRGGPWGYMCTGCFAFDGVGLGMGVGQVLLCGDAQDAKLKKSLLGVTS